MICHSASLADPDFEIRTYWKTVRWVQSWRPCLLRSRNQGSRAASSGNEEWYARTFTQSNTSTLSVLELTPARADEVSGNPQILLYWSPCLAKIEPLRRSHFQKPRVRFSHHVFCLLYLSDSRSDSHLAWKGIGFEAGWLGPSCLFRLLIFDRKVRKLSSKSALMNRRTASTFVDFEPRERRQSHFVEALGLSTCCSGLCHIFLSQIQISRTVPSILVSLASFSLTILGNFSAEIICSPKAIQLGFIDRSPLKVCVTFAWVSA